MLIRPLFWWVFQHGEGAWASVCWEWKFCWPVLHLAFPSITGKIFKICLSTAFCGGCTYPEIQNTHLEFLKELGLCPCSEEKQLENDIFMYCLSILQWGSGFALSLAVILQVVDANTVCILMATSVVAANATFHPKCDSMFTFLITLWGNPSSIAGWQGRACLNPPLLLPVIHADLQLGHFKAVPQKWQVCLSKRRADWAVEHLLFLCGVSLLIMWNDHTTKYCRLLLFHYSGFSLLWEGKDITADYLLDPVVSSVLSHVFYTVFVFHLPMLAIPRQKHSSLIAALQSSFGRLIMIEGWHLPVIILSAESCC